MKVPDKSKRIVVIVNAEWYFRLHWLPLIIRLKKKGNYDITVITSDERGETEMVRNEGLRVILVPFARNTSNPVLELLRLFSIIKIVRNIKPDLIHNLTINPIILGSLAGKILGVPGILNSITGLGYTFIQKGLYGEILKRIVMAGYRIIFSAANISVSFQNYEDQKYLAANKVVSFKQSNVILGVGVDTKKFIRTPIPTDQRRIIMATRMLWDKGVREFVKAAVLLQTLNPRVNMVLVGIPDESNPQSVPETLLKGWHEKNIIDWWGHHSDMPAVLGRSSIVVLPSYREGLPTILIEAASSGRPIITTDVPGCREVVIDGYNGYLVPPKDHVILADRINYLVENQKLMTEMGQKSREISEKMFALEKIFDQYWTLYNGMIL